MSFKKIHIVHATLLSLFPAFAGTSLCLLTSGCTTPSEEPLDPSGSDKLPISACAKCDDKEIFYKNGFWLKERP